MADNIGATGRLPAPTTINPHVMLSNAKYVEVLTPAGTSLGIFKQISEWNGYRELRHVDTNEKMIIEPTGSGGFMGLFNELFNDKSVEAQVASASPQLLHQMAQEQSQVEKGQTV